MLGTQELKDIKKQLKDFSHAPILKSYRLIAQIYKADISEQSLIDSEITKSFVRIARKPYTESDDAKYQKTIKICRKMVKKWKEMLKGECKVKSNEKDEGQIQKKVKTNGNSTSQQAPLDENRKKAMLAFQKYLSKDNNQEHSELAIELDNEIAKQYQEEDIYKEKVKLLVKKIDQNKDFKQKLIDQQITAQEAVNSLMDY